MLGPTLAVMVCVSKVLLSCPAQSYDVVEGDVHPLGLMRLPEMYNFCINILHRLRYFPYNLQEQINK